MRGENMNSIEILKQEHVVIKKAIEVVRKICLEIVKGKQVPYEDFYSIIDFVRNYADRYHHAKEEDMLFIHMNEELESKIGEGPVQGMLIEHNLGRGFMMDLELALKSHSEGNEESVLDIVAAAMGYANLLTKHINKEDNMLYVFADKNLKRETIELLNSQFEELENKEENIKEREKYISIAKELEEKYLK
jgi:hemerythrin-like domain-containing protein